MPDFSIADGDKVDLSGWHVGDFATVQQLGLVKTVDGDVALQIIRNGIAYTLVLDGLADPAALTAASLVFSTTVNDGVDAVSLGDGVDVASGGFGNDTLYSYAGSDTLSGGDGNDYLDAGNDNDVAFGDAGIDTIFGGNGNDTISGGDGDDYLDGGAGNDILSGGIGADTLIGGAGLNTVTGGADADVFTVPSQFDGAGATTVVTDFSVADGDRIDLSGWHVADFATVQEMGLIKTVGGDVVLQMTRNSIAYTLVLDGVTDPAVLTAASFVFSTTVNDGIDAVSLGDGVDVASGGFGNDTLYSYAGNDTLSGGDGNDYLDAGNDNDLVFGDAGIDTILGGAGNDTISGGDGDDYLDGGNGNDTISGGSGADTLIGGAGLNTVTGGADADVFTVPSQFDGAGATTVVTDFSIADGDRIDLSGWHVADFATVQEMGLIKTVGGDVVLQMTRSSVAYTLVLDGITDPTVLTAASFVFSTSVNDGVDAFGLGDGVDVVSGGLGNDTLYAYGANDTISGGDGNDYLDAGSDDDVVFGDAGNDTISGGNGNDTISGGAGADYLDGGAGNDIMSGGSGADTLVGGVGLNTVTGGADADVFAVPSQIDGVGTTTVVTDFSVADGDRIDVSGWHVGDFATVQELGLIKIVDGDVVLQVTRNSIAYTLVLDGVSDPSVLTAASFVFSTSVNDGVDAFGLSDGVDVVSGGLGNDTLYTYGANDTVSGGDGNDYLDAGNDNDIVFGDAGADTIFGGAGNDTISGGEGADYLDGGAGNDIISGGNGADILIGGAGLNTVTGGADADVFTVPSQFDGAGATTLVTDFSIVDGDRIDVSGWHVGDFATIQELGLIKTVDGDVVLQMTRGGIAYSLVLDGVSDPAALTAASFVYSTTVNDGVDAFGLTDSIDVVSGGLGNDTLYTYSANDTVSGGDGNDYLDAGNDNDVVFGDAGADTIFGGNGDDTLSGGADDDIVDGGAGNDSLSGDGGADTLLGGADNDVLSGGDGDDSLNGGIGNDTLAGDAGKDRLDGGSGLNTLTGGADADTFIVPSDFNGLGATTVVTDFSVAGGDKVDLTSWGISTFAALQTSGLLTSVDGNVAFRKVVDGVAYTLVLDGVTDPADLTDGNFDFADLAVTVPADLELGETGTTTVYYNPPGETSGPVLLIVEATGAVVADPLTGRFSSSAMILVPASDDGAPVSIELATRVGSTQQPGISAIVADPADTIDWAAQKEAIRPAGLSNETWDRVFDAFVDAVGSTVGSLTTALTQNADLLKSFGINGSSGGAALGFELEQAGDFGSLAARDVTGSMGEGWRTAADIALEANADGTFEIHGLTDFAALFSLSGADAARYTLSASVDRSVDLRGLISDDPAPVSLVLSHNGDFSGYSAPDGSTLAINDAGEFVLTTTDGAVLRFASDGELIDARNPSGDVTTATYDVNGRMTGLVDSGGRALNFTRDAQGHLTEISDSDGYSVDLTYSSDGNFLASAASQGGTVAFTYGASGDLSRADHAGTTATQTFTYDSRGRLSGIDAGGTTSETYTYDATGGYTITDGTGAGTDVALLPNGTRGSLTDALGNEARFVFDSQGNLVGMRDAAGNLSDIEMDAAGRPVSVSDPTGATFTITYDGDSIRPASMTDANGSARTFAYDAEGRMTRATSSDGTAVAFTYDADGSLTGYTNRRGDGISYVYDAQGRLVSANDPSTGGITYAYDAEGRTTSATTDDGTTSMTYDAAGRITSIEYPNGHSLAYEYDIAGRRTSMTDEAGRSQTYSYDAAGRLASFGDETGVKVIYSYDAAGRLAQEENANGTSTNYSYDAAGRLLSIVNLAADSSENSHNTYTYDAAGRRTGMETQDGNWSYGYDASGQLTSADFTSTRAGLADKHLAYTYDAAGNRLTSVEDGVTTNYVANGLNQYVSAGNETFTHDADGNLLTRTDASGTTTYAYDALDRLTSVTGADGKVTAYDYDIFGNRSAVIEDGVRTDYLVDPFGRGNVVAEYGSDGALTTSYLYGLVLEAQRGASGSYAFYDTDAASSVTGLTDATGELVGSYGYTPFGQTLYENEGVANMFEFNGGLGISEDATGLYYMRARQYDAELGRFTAEDPLWLTGDIGNLYRFAGNDPISYVDPTGLFVMNGGFSGMAYGALGVGGGFGFYFDSDTWEAGTYTTVDGGAGVGLGFGGQFGFSPDMQAFSGLSFVAGGGAGPASFEVGYSPGSAWPSVAWTPGVGAGGKASASYTWTYPFAGGSTGDPHLYTFDGLAYDFQAVGEFTLVRVAEHGFELQVRQEAIPNSSVSINAAVAMSFGGAVAEYNATDGQLLINGQVVTLANGATMAVGNGAISVSGSLWTFANAYGEGVTFSVSGTRLDLQAFIGSVDSGKATGLLGNSNGNAADDIALANGTVITGPVADNVLYGAYADGWRVTDQSSLFTYGEGESTATYTNRNFPHVIFTVDDLPADVRAAAEQVATNAGLVPGTVAFNNAVLDVALTGDASYATAAAAIDIGTEEPVELEINHAPTGTGTATLAGGTEDKVYTVNAADLLAGFSDPDGEDISVADLVASDGATVTDELDGTYTVTFAANFNGVLTLSYNVADTSGGKKAVSTTITVAATSDPPSVGDGIADQTVAEDQPWTFAVPAQALVDPDGDALTYSATLGDGSVLPAWLSFDPATQTFTGTPPAKFNGPIALTVTVSDGLATASDTFNLTVTPVNDAPSDIALSATTVKEDVKAGAVIATLSGTDPDAGDSITFTLTDDAGGVFAIVGGELVLAAGQSLDFETTNSYAITVRATDAAGLQFDEAFTIGVTDVVDRVTGNGSPNKLEGAGGADIITGLGGADRLYGFAGRDTLDGGKGRDKLYGGEDADTFVFKTGDSGKSRGSADTIYDFARGDVIDLTGWDANSRQKGVQDFDFIGKDGFSKEAGELHFVKTKSDTWIEGDTNGDGKADFVIHLDDAVKLKAGSFDL